MELNSLIPIGSYVKIDKSKIKKDLPKILLDKLPLDFNTASTKWFARISLSLVLDDNTLYKLSSFPSSFDS